MKMPRKLTATAISALALALGVTTLQAPSASAADRTIYAPTATLANLNAQPNDLIESVSPGEEVKFWFVAPAGPLGAAYHDNNGTGGEKDGGGTIIFRDPQSGIEEILDSFPLPNYTAAGPTGAWSRKFTTPLTPGGELCGIAFFPADIIKVGKNINGQWLREPVPAISAETCVTIRPISNSTIFPRAPYLSTEAAREGVYPTATVDITASLAGQLAPGEVVTSRSVVTSTTNTGDPSSCAIEDNVERSSPGGEPPFRVTLRREIPAGTVGQYLCMQQSVKTNRMAEARFSEPVTYRITSNPNVGADFIILDLGSSLARLLEATQLLEQVQEQPNIDQAELARAAAEAEEARRQAEAAAAQAQARAAAAAAQGQAAPAGTPSAAQIAQAQQEAAAAAAAVEQAIGQATAGTTKQTALSALAIATGFDPFTTPVLQAREKNASGVSIEVTAPKTIRQKKRLRTKLEVLDPVTRGGMRQYLLDLSGPTPKLLLKRTGFVPRGVKNKRFWISKKFQPGTYGLLTTFLPSTPGIQGVAVYDTIEVTKAPKKKRGKKKNRN